MTPLLNFTVCYRLGRWLFFSHCFSRGGARSLALHLTVNKMASVFIFIVIACHLFFTGARTGAVLFFRTFVDLNHRAF